ncbi:MAG: hypothetical protein GX316_06770 [Firmicutes bacterium]|nr:hypothetical protein [Bacillota bacterium]
MVFCEKLLVPRVISDEIFYLEDDEFAIPIGEIPVPPDSTIDGVVTVSVLQCTPRVDLALNEIFVDVVFMIQKELTITTPEGSLIPLEFGFRLERTVGYRKVLPLELEAINPDYLLDLECHILYVTGTDVVTLHPSTIDPVTGALLNDATCDEELTIQMKLMLIQDRQMTVSGCDPRHRVDIGITV